MPVRSKRRRVRTLAAGLIIVVGILLAAELWARFHLGLGDPPLSISHPQIEYMFAPSQEVRRFGNRIHYNAWSMRSDDFPKTKSDPAELRVLMLGDSVINGGALTDQSQIASEILKRWLGERLNRSVVVGNISAGTWGPANLLAYVREFEFFDADVVVIVLSSHDIADLPTFVPVVGVQRDFPDRKPLLALQEGFTRYLLPRLIGPGSTDAGIPQAVAPTTQQIEQGAQAVRDLIAAAQAHGVPVIVALHLSAEEQTTAPESGNAMIDSIARDLGARVIQLGPAEKRAIEGGQSPYRDSIHPNAIGQRVIAQELLEPIVEAVSRTPATSPVDTKTPGG